MIAAPHDLRGRLEPVLERLHAMHPRVIDLSLGRIEKLLDLLGNPQRRLPPVIHVAGTNGKGSTCAFLRAIAESAGLRVHVYTSPHLVHFNERIRIAGTLADDAMLLAALEEIEAAGALAPVTVFEAITAAAFLLFSRVPADLCILEVGLGGKLDATNVDVPVVAAAITSLSLDHQSFLGDTLEQIAGEKAGIARSFVPLITGFQQEPAMQVIAAAAAARGAVLNQRGTSWQIEQRGDGLHFQDASGALDLPLPSLPGTHQIENAGIAIAALRASGLPIPNAAYGAIAEAEWPGRMQRLTGKLAALLPPHAELWLDGGHNPGAGIILAEHLRLWRDKPTHLVIGMKDSKDVAGFLAPLTPLAASVWAIAEPGQHLALTPERIVAASGGAARIGPRIADALRSIARADTPCRVLICGSLYLAGEVLKLDAGALPIAG